MADAGKIKNSDLRNRTEKELQLMLEERNQELMNLRFQRAAARLEKPTRIRAVRRERARILTILKIKETTK